MNRMDALNIGLGQEQLSFDLENLWEAYFVSRDETLRNRLIVHYLPLSRMIARHIHGRTGGAADLDDLCQAAALGLRAAIASFNPERGISFENYCGPRVRGAILDHLRSLDWAPRMLRSRVKRVREMVSRIEMETGTPPTDEHVASVLDMPLDELRELRTDMAVSIRQTTNADDPESGFNLDALPDRGNFDPTIEAQRTDLREFLVRGLNQVERQVLLLYYYDNLSFREIGETLELCESRASQIHQSVIRRLRERQHRIGGMTIE
jgi:RNA polymerase sigma factor for flagellar operon FliA